MVDTEIININPRNLDLGQLEMAAKLLRQEEVVGFPTETVYGLGASALSTVATKKIFEAKGRPQDNPLIVHVSSQEMLHTIVQNIPPIAQLLIDKFWPGPLTILFQKSPIIPDSVTAGLSTVAIRMPENIIARKLIELANLPIAAPSANISGKPSPTTAQHVYRDLKGKIPLIIDGGPCDIGLESTVVDVMRHPPMVLRPGGLSFEDLLQVIPDLQIYEKSTPIEALEKNPSTPGLKYRHYSPNAKIILLSSPLNQVHLQDLEISEKILSFTHLRRCAYIHSNQNISIPTDWPTHFSVFRNILHHTEMAHALFALFREMDEKQMDFIFIEEISEKFVGLAVMNRLKKATSEIWEIN